MGEIIFTILLDIGIDLAIENTKYYVKKNIDGIVRLVRSLDTDNDGAYEDVVIAELGTITFDVNADYNIVSDGDTIGIGTAAIEIIDGMDLPNYIDTFVPGDYPVISYNDGVYIYDVDNDGDNDTVIPLDDLTGDGFGDFGLVLDEDDNGVPDVADDTPYYPIGTDEYNTIVRRMSNEPSMIIVSSDGTMTVYDTSGQITAEDCDTAYSLWVSENGIMTKPLDNYTVTEGILFISFLVGCFGFIGMLCRRKRVM